MRSSHTYIHTYIDAYIHTYIRTHAYVEIDIYTHTYMYAYIHVHTYILMQVEYVLYTDEGHGFARPPNRYMPKDTSFSGNPKLIFNAYVYTNRAPGNVHVCTKIKFL
jgi:hypothetical protein